MSVEHPTLRQKISRSWSQDPLEIFIAKIIFHSRKKIFSIFPQKQEFRKQEEIGQEEISIDAKKYLYYYWSPIIPHISKGISSPKLNLLRLNLVLPGFKFSDIFGGISTALMLLFLVKEKFSEIDLRIVIFEGEANKEDILTHLKMVFGEEKAKHLNFELVYRLDAKKPFNLDIHNGDFFIATLWLSYYAIKDLLGGKPFFYLIQDFEPSFYPHDDSYAAALNTYSQNCIPIFNSFLLQEYFISKQIISKDVIEKGCFFNPYFNVLKNPKNSNLKSKKRLFLYGRPNIPRNLFGTAVTALTLAIQDGIFDETEWEFISAGEMHKPIKLSEKSVLNSFGKMNYADYQEFLKTVDLGLSLMLSAHPSYPPLEIVYAGAICVTNRYANKQLDLLHPNIVSCEPSVEGVLQGLKLALAKNKTLDNPDIPFGNNSWKEALKPAVDLIGKNIRGLE